MLAFVSWTDSDGGSTLIAPPPPPSFFPRPPTLLTCHEARSVQTIIHPKTVLDRFRWWVIHLPPPPPSPLTLLIGHDARKSVQTTIHSKEELTASEGPQKEYTREASAGGSASNGHGMDAFRRSMALANSNGPTSVFGTKGLIPFVHVWHGQSTLFC